MHRNRRVFSVFFSSSLFTFIYAGVAEVLTASVCVSGQWTYVGRLPEPRQQVASRPQVSALRLQLFLVLLTPHRTKSGTQGLARIAGGGDDGFLGSVWPRCLGCLYCNVQFVLDILTVSKRPLRLDLTNGCRRSPLWQLATPRFLCTQSCGGHYSYVDRPPLPSLLCPLGGLIRPQESLSKRPLYLKSVT